jgi:hypothetical protein
MWVLFLIAIMTALSMSFLQKVSIRTAVNATRHKAIQAEYLAKAAVNHALWRIQNEPGFPAASNVYYMHDLGGGRYGYKVRKPTLTKFATIATVGAVDNVINRQSYVPYIKPHNIITAYGRLLDQIPKYRQLITADWNAPADTLDIGDDMIAWLRLAGCASRREIIMGTVDYSSILGLAVWDGTSWGNQKVFTAATLEYCRAFDIAYESQSDDALVVGRYDPSSTVYYMIWNGSAWVQTSPQPAFSLAGDEVVFLTMASNPASDEILIGVLGFSTLQLFRWDGDAFSSLGLIENQLGSGEPYAVEIVYESQSGHALIIWAGKNSSVLSYLVWDGSTLGSELQSMDIGNTAEHIRADADPTSDYILVAAKDKANDLNVVLWDGSAFTDSRKVETTCQSLTATPILDVAWENSGNEAIAVWGKSNVQIVQYFQWQKGTALSTGAIQAGGDFQANLQGMLLFPFSNSDKMILMAMNQSMQIHSCLWTGNKWLPNPPFQIEGSGQDRYYLPFDIAEFNEGAGGGGGPPDTTPPTPDPMTWDSPPAASGPTSVTMTATTATDENGVEYFFECTAGGGHDSGWQDSPTYVDTGLSPSTQYTYRVKARDKSTNQNETLFSLEWSATTDPPAGEIYVYDITMSLRPGFAGRYFGQATVWIKDDGGADVQGATVYGDWSGCGIESSNGVTGADGKVMLETVDEKKKCTFFFTVTDVVKAGSSYNPALNNETSDSIPAP